jgi:hypothetical protein
VPGGWSCRRQVDLHDQAAAGAGAGRAGAAVRAGTFLGGTYTQSLARTKCMRSQVNAVYNLLGDQANPQDPSGVDVSQPSNPLVAQADAKSAFSTLFLGLGAVALLDLALEPV